MSTLRAQTVNSDYKQAGERVLASPGNSAEMSLGPFFQCPSHPEGLQSRKDLASRHIAAGPQTVPCQILRKLGMTPCTKVEAVSRSHFQQFEINRHANHRIDTHDVQAINLFLCPDAAGHDQSSLRSRCAVQKPHRAAYPAAVLPYQYGYRESRRTRLRARASFAPRKFP